MIDLFTSPRPRVYIGPSAYIDEVTQEDIDLEIADRERELARERAHSWAM